MLCRLPAHVAAACPVDCKCALRAKNSHNGKGATTIFDQIMTACGNGDLCSRLLCSAVNNSCLEKAARHCSHFAEKNTNGTAFVKPCVQKDGGHTQLFPPTGETIRELFDDALNNSSTLWGISDHDRHAREIQGVTCRLTVAQDHTFDVLHNCQKKLGASALWDVETETGKWPAQCQCQPQRQFTSPMRHNNWRKEKSCTVTLVPTRVLFGLFFSTTLKGNWVSSIASNE